MKPRAPMKRDLRFRLKDRDCHVHVHADCRAGALLPMLVSSFCRSVCEIFVGQQEFGEDSFRPEISE